MRINNNYNNHYSQNFGNKVESIKLIETLIGRNIESKDISGFREIVSEFQPQYKNASGHHGYYKLSQMIADKIFDQYKTNEFVIEALKLRQLNKANPQISTAELQEYSKAIIEKQGKEIDITLKNI